MLVLSRKANETIRIGEDITVEVRRVAGNRVTLAIDAPRSVRILRGELEQIAKEFETPAEKTPQATSQTEEVYRVSHRRAPLDRMPVTALSNQEVMSTTGAGI